MTRPACAGRLDIDWFSDVEAEQQAAAALCRRCGARQRCEEGARARGEQYGIWNGKRADCGFVEVAAPAVEVMVVAEPTAFLRVSVPMVHGSRSSYLICRDGDDGKACRECKASNASYVAEHREKGPVTPRPIVIDNRIPLFEGVSA